MRFWSSPPIVKIINSIHKSLNNTNQKTFLKTSFSLSPSFPTATSTKSPKMNSKWKIMCFLNSCPPFPPRKFILEAWYSKEWVRALALEKHVCLVFWGFFLLLVFLFFSQWFTFVEPLFPCLKNGNNTLLTIFDNHMRCLHGESHNILTLYMRVLRRTPSSYCFPFVWLCLSTTWHQQCLPHLESFTSTKQHLRFFFSF